jgi:acetyltransferase-like isoleucine patch superfamily enzyme
MAKRAAKAAARGLATAAMLPAVLGYRASALVLGPNRALEGWSQALSLLPGLPGSLLRRAFLARVLAGCHPTADVGFGTLFSQAGARLDADVYVGPRCHLGLVHLKRGCLIAAGVHLPSGGNTHRFADPTVPIKDQGGERRLVTVGAGAWVGSNAVVLADVGDGAVVGAGSVVTRPIPAYAVAAGVPARVIRSRLPDGPGAGTGGPT